MVCNFYKNITSASSQINNKLVKKIISLTAKEVKQEGNFEITILLIGDKKIRSLNKKYRHKDSVTDVLSFSQKEGQAIVLPDKEAHYLGDIFIAYPQVIKQAKKYNHSDKEEFSLLLIHGVLHLLGYDHVTKKDDITMKQIQEKIMTKLYD
jgi:probable rRNA maturation factor